MRLEISFAENNLCIDLMGFALEIVGMKLHQQPQETTL